MHKYKKNNAIFKAELLKMSPENDNDVAILAKYFNLTPFCACKIKTQE